MIKVAKTAKEKVEMLMKEEGFNPSQDYVRVGVKSGGCSGLSYDLKFDRTLQGDDKLFEDNEVRILVDKKKPTLLDRHYARVFWWTQWKRLCVQQS